MSEELRMERPLSARETRLRAQIDTELENVQAWQWLRARVREWSEARVKWWPAEAIEVPAIVIKKFQLVQPVRLMPKNKKRKPNAVVNKKFQMVQREYQANRSLVPLEEGESTTFLDRCAVIAAFWDVAGKSPRLGERGQLGESRDGIDRHEEHADRCGWKFATLRVRVATATEEDLQGIWGYWTEVKQELQKVTTKSGPDVQPEAVKPAKRSEPRKTRKGDAQEKLVAALTKHHDYANGSCLNQEPVGVRQLAQLAGVAESSASEFFKKHFEGHQTYEAACRKNSDLIASIKLLNREFAPRHLIGKDPMMQSDRKDGGEE